MGPVPAGWHEPRVKILAAVNGRKGDWPGSDPPMVVGADDVHGPVRVFEPDLGDGLEGTKGALKFSEPSAMNVIHAIAEQQADRVGAGVEEWRQIPRVV